MKRLKVLLSAVLACVFAFTFALAGCGGSETELQSIELDTSGAKTEYSTGEEFSSEGLVVTAIILDTSDNTTSTVDVTSDAVIDSSNYRTTTGTYTIYVSYTLNDVTQSASYTVTVSVATTYTFVDLNVDTSSAKTEYFIGEDFSSEGLVVMATIRTRSSSGTSLTEEVVDLGDVVIDSSSFDNQTAGTYTITVACTLYETTLETTYTVSVDESVRLSSLLIDYTNAQTRYNLADEFSYEGLVVTAVIYDYSSGTQTETFSVSLDDENLVIDSSSFDNTQEGQYTIPVSYTYEGVTVSATYTVRVLVGAGLYMEIVDGDNVYDISASYAMQLGGTTIDLSDIDVYLADVNGKTSTLLTEGYTFKVFYGDEEVEVTNNKFVAENAGAYNVWAYYENYTIPGTSITVDLDDFMIIYVTDTLVSIELSNPGTAVTTQSAGSDVISSTWEFTATYSSGTTKQLTIDDVEVSGLDTRTATDSGVATISYTEYDTVSGNEITRTTTVNYVIEASSGTVSEKFEFSYDELTAAIESALGSATDKTALTSEYFNTASNSFLTVNISDSNDQYRTSGNGCFEIKNGSVSVTFSGTGTLTITVSSTGGSNTSEIGLIDSEGNYISATITGTNAVENDAGYYEVTGTTYVTLMFDITEAGTYSLVSNLGTNNRGVRIQTIVMVDNY